MGIQVDKTYLSNELGNEDLRSLKSLDLSKKQVSCVQDISQCVHLRKLNLSHNEILSSDSLLGIVNNVNLTWLNLSNNKLDSADFVRKLTMLSVLNLSQNSLKNIPIHVQNLEKLKALILNNNEISMIENLDSLSKLNTLVLSHNQICELDGLDALTSLSKLSVAHNEITSFPRLQTLKNLKELRLNDNKICNIPEWVQDLSSLEILDIGNNSISNLDDLSNLSSCPNLHQLNIKGNPVAEHPEFKQKIMEHIPELRVLNGLRFDEKFLERKEKRRLREKHENLKAFRKKRRQLSRDKKVEIGKKIN